MSKEKRENLSVNRQRRGKQTKQYFRRHVTEAKDSKCRLNVPLTSFRQKMLISFTALSSCDRGCKKPKNTSTFK